MAERLVDEYDFSFQTRGVALIVNNQRFEEHDPQLPTRAGSRHDTENLKLIFQKLGFEDIRIKIDLTAREMTDWLESVAEEDHTYHDCLACALLSHGNETFTRLTDRVSQRHDVISGTDDDITTNHLIQIFNDANCPTLAGKPRFFIMQACRGEQLDDAVEVAVDEVDEVDGMMVEPAYTTTPVPCFKDSIVVCASAPGYASVRQPRGGSVFIRNLSDVILNYDVTQLELQKLLTRVRQQVAVGFESKSSRDPSRHMKKQMPCVYSMLTKDVYFRNKSNVTTQCA
ncbi:caspase-3-like [Gigantopelta aegis]|uniref:caspase-3-like n=1 Tax=Gigantopelta aegis TaxID=1735272 RepID=UPI001B88BBD0|nr:caspase-3-like [Gigantopelta aegis]